MKHLWFMLLLLGCHSGSPDNTCMDCGGGSGDVDGGVPGDHGNPQSCELTSTPGPVGHLVDYQVAGGSEWLLTQNDDGRSTLLEDSGSGWRARLFGTTCFAGVMTIGPDEHPRVACLVRSGAAMVYDLRVFDVGPSETSSTLVVEGVLEGGLTWNAFPLSISVDAVGRPTLLWQAASGLDAGVYFGCGLARLVGEAWTDVGTYETILDRGTVLRSAGEEFRALYRDEAAGAVVVARAGVELTTVAELTAAEHAFAVAGAADGALHVTTIGEDATLRYRRLAQSASTPRVLAHDAVHAEVTVDDDGDAIVIYGSAADGLIVARESEDWAPLSIDPDPGVRALVRTAGGRLRIAYQREPGGATELLREECAP